MNVNKRRVELMAMLMASVNESRSNVTVLTLHVSKVILWWWQHAHHQVQRQSVLVGSTLQQMFCLAAGSDRATWRVNGAVKLTDNWSSAYWLRMPRINHLLSGRTYVGVWVRSNKTRTTDRSSTVRLCSFCVARIYQKSLQRAALHWRRQYAPRTCLRSVALRCRRRGHVHTSLVSHTHTLCVCVCGCACVRVCVDVVMMAHLCDHAYFNAVCGLIWLRATTLTSAFYVL